MLIRVTVYSCSCFVIIVVFRTLVLFCNYVIMLIRVTVYSCSCFVIILVFWTLDINTCSVMLVNTRNSSYAFCSLSFLNKIQIMIQSQLLTGPINLVYFLFDQQCLLKHQNKRSALNLILQ